MSCPATDRILSPGSSPTEAAALLGRTVPITFVLGPPSVMKMAVKIRIASRKLAIGPAATIAARAPIDLWKKLTRRSASSIVSKPERSQVSALVSMIQVLASFSY